MHSTRRISFRGALVASAIALATIAASAAAQTYDFRVLHRFTNAPNDAAHPMAPMQFDAAGNLYGTTGSDAVGPRSIFKIAPDGTGIILAGRDSDAPVYYPVTVDPATGDLYGISRTSEAVLYKLAADGTSTVLHVFKAPYDGIYNDSVVLRDPQGNLYGTAEEGGIPRKGMVYKYGANGRFTVLHTFTGTDGSYPAGGLIRDQAGNLYGATATGGPGQFGTLFKLAPDGALITLYAFTGGADGSAPSGPLARDKEGNLYGIAATYDPENFTDGTVFKWAPTGVLTTLHLFSTSEPGKGYSPNNGLVLIRGNLYGTTLNGGTRHCVTGFNYRCGVVFKIAADGTYSVVHDFIHRDGARPFSGLVYKDNRLYGNTYLGGLRNDTSNDSGTVYSIGIDR